MKPASSFSIIRLAGAVFFLAASPSFAAAQEQLTVDFTATTTGGEYAPANIEAVWVLSGTTFVKTIGRWAQTRRSHLIAWRAAAGTTDVDAVSGATNDDYVPLSLTWDLTDRSGATVPDGTYTIRIESCDSNASAESENHQATFTFEKNGTASTQTPTAAGFSNVTVTYTGRTAEADAGMPPADAGTATDSGTPPVDSGAPIDSGTPPADSGSGADSGSAGGSGVAPVSGCSVAAGTAPSHTIWFLFAAIGVLAVAQRRRASR